KCGKVLDMGSYSGGREMNPHKGAICICAYCSELSVFDEAEDGLYFRRPTEEEWLELARNPYVVAMQELVTNYLEKALQDEVNRFSKEVLDGQEEGERGTG